MQILFYCSSTFYYDNIYAEWKWKGTIEWVHEGTRALSSSYVAKAAKEREPRNFLFLLSASSLCLLNGRYIVCVLFLCYPKSYQQFTFCVNIERVRQIFLIRNFFLCFKAFKENFLVGAKVFWSHDNKAREFIFENNVLQRIKPRGA